MSLHVTGSIHQLQMFKPVRVQIIEYKDLGASAAASKPCMQCRCRYACRARVVDGQQQLTHLPGACSLPVITHRLNFTGTWGYVRTYSTHASLPHSGSIAPACQPTYRRPVSNSNANKGKHLASPLCSLLVALLRTLCHTVMMAAYHIAAQPVTLFPHHACTHPMSPGVERYISKRGASLSLLV
ncbi:unnamed protein product [Periconia digitata]|uniref:Uncharacterized protein n=1 Tax=Periconia digitata TaxID=1303443 RepID=A0A9W4U8I0_9PLEO|nr:unnamed protein product [Periconia digitata]